jgi:enoyl-CoA hydratase
MLETEDRSGITLLRMTHGKVNAMDTELLRAVSAAVRGLDPAQPVVLTGTGSAFSAGVDLRRIADGGPDYVAEFLPALSEMFLAVFDHPGPVLAAVNGHAIAGGCVLAAACDFRAMSQGTIGLAELTVGVPFPPAALEIMRHAVGPVASELVLTAVMLSPGQARSAGLVHEVEAPDALLDLVTLRAQALARIAPDVYAFSKRQLQAPARERIAASRGDDAAVEAMWSAPATLDAIAAYVKALATRRS